MLANTAGPPALRAARRAPVRAATSPSGCGLGGNESYPEVFAPFGGFADDSPVVDGRVALPDVPGIGFEAKSALYAVLRELR